MLLHLEQTSCPLPLQGLGRMGPSTKQLWPSVNYLLLVEHLRLALAVGLDAANVVGCGAMQNLQKLLQGGLQRGETVGQAAGGAPAGPWLVTPPSSPPSPESWILTCPE